VIGKSIEISATSMSPVTYTPSIPFTSPVHVDPINNNGINISNNKIQVEEKEKNSNSQSSSPNNIIGSPTIGNTTNITDFQNNNNNNNFADELKESTIDNNAITRSNSDLLNTLYVIYFIFFIHFCDSFL
jgi:hypothetical protein